MRPGFIKLAFVRQTLVAIISLTVNKPIDGAGAHVWCIVKEMMPEKGREVSAEVPWPYRH